VEGGEHLVEQPVVAFLGGDQVVVEQNGQKTAALLPGDDRDDPIHQITHGHGQLSLAAAQSCLCGVQRRQDDLFPLIQAMTEDSLQQPLAAAEVVIDHGVVDLGLGDQAAIAHLVAVVLGEEPRARLDEPKPRHIFARVLLLHAVPFLRVVRSLYRNPERVPTTWLNQTVSFPLPLLKVQSNFSIDFEVHFQ
jgi:hypothetical protein